MKEVWDERYRNDFIYGKEPNDFLKQKLNKQKNGKILCLAEGQGRNAVYMATLGYEVTAIDLSQEGLTKAKELAKEKGQSIHIQVMNLHNFKTKPEDWDGIINIFGHFPEDVRKHVHKQVVLGLKPGGFYIMEAYSKEQINMNTGGPKSEHLLYSLEDIVSDLKSQLDFQIAHKTQRVVQEGSLHTGLASVIQIFGIKKV